MVYFDEEINNVFLSLKFKLIFENFKLVSQWK